MDYHDYLDKKQEDIDNETSNLTLKKVDHKPTISAKRWNESTGDPKPDEIFTLDIVVLERELSIREKQVATLKELIVDIKKL